MFSVFIYGCQKWGFGEKKDQLVLENYGRETVERRIQVWLAAAGVNVESEKSREGFGFCQWVYLCAMAVVFDAVAVVLGLIWV